MACYSCGTPYCSCSNRYTSSGCNPCYSTPCYVTSGCPIQLDFSCILYHKNNNEVTELDGLNLSNGATLELVIETLDEKIKQLAVLDFSLPYLRSLYVINTMKQFVEAVDTELSGITSGTASSGTYTPTIQEVTVTSVPITASIHTYTRVGDIVTVYGSIAITDMVVDNDTIVTITLPVASNFASTANLNGVATSSSNGNSSITGDISANVAGDVAQLQFNTGLTDAAYTLYYSFQYRVL